jgi:hypothetical protein
MSRSHRRAVPGWASDPVLLLAAVCLLHLVVTVALVAAQHVWWQQDEAVYVSQVGAHTPALVFTPPRARGLPVLLFPVAHFTTRVWVLRVYLAALGSLALYLSLLPWLRLGFGRLVALAALLFSGLWVASFIGAAVQPNFFVATAAMAVVGWVAVACRRVTPPQLLTVVAWTALFALLRPSDATWATVALLGGLAVARSAPPRARMAIGGALVAGLAAGWSEWVIEAFVSYGGLTHRLHEATAYNTPGLHFSLLAEARTVDGPVLCRPCSGVPLSATHVAWWFPVPPLVALALARARRQPQLFPLALGTAVGVALLLEYCFTVDYAAPRFLLPTYLLLAVPCAVGLAAFVERWSSPEVRWWVAGPAAGLLLVQVIAQVRVLDHAVDDATAVRHRFLAAARVLRDAGVRPPCIVYGNYGPPVGYALGCNDHPFGTDALGRVPTGTAVAILTLLPQPTWFQHWRSVALRPGGWTAHLLIAGSARRASAVRAACARDPRLHLTLVCKTSNAPP